MLNMGFYGKMLILYSPAWVMSIRNSYSQQQCTCRDRFTCSESVKKPGSSQANLKEIPETIDHYFIATASETVLIVYLVMSRRKTSSKQLFFVTPGSMWRSSMKYLISVLEVLK